MKKLFLKESIAIVVTMTCWVLISLVVVPAVQPSTLLAVTHRLYCRFEEIPNMERRGVLDLSKAFDRIWHEGLVFTILVVNCATLFVCYVLLVLFQFFALN